MASSILRFAPHLSLSRDDGSKMIKRLLSNGFILMTLSAFFFALADILVKYLSPTMGTIQIAFVRFFLGVLMLVPVMRARGESLKGSSIRVLLVRGLTGTLAFFIAQFSLPGLPQSSLLVLLAVLYLVAQIFMNQGFKYCKASEGAVIMMSEVMFAGIAGVVIFNDSLFLSFWVGACLIVGSGVGLNVMTRQPRPLKDAPVILH